MKTGRRSARLPVNNRHITLTISGRCIDAVGRRVRSIGLAAQECRNLQLVVFLDRAALRRQPALIVKLATARRVERWILAGETAHFRRRLTQLRLARLRWLKPGRLFLTAGEAV